MLLKVEYENIARYVVVAAAAATAIYLLYSDPDRITYALFVTQFTSQKKRGKKHTYTKANDDFTGKFTFTVCCLYLVDKENLCVFIVPVSQSMVEIQHVLNKASPPISPSSIPLKIIHAKRHANERTNKRADRQKNDDDD